MYLSFVRSMIYNCVCYSLFYTLMIMFWYDKFWWLYSDLTNSDCMHFSLLSDIPVKKLLQLFELSLTLLNSLMLVQLHLWNSPCLTHNLSLPLRLPYFLDCRYVISCRILFIPSMSTESLNRKYESIFFVFSNQKRKERCLNKHTQVLLWDLRYVVEGKIQVHCWY